MHRPGWYVVQVQTGRETQMCERIEQRCAELDEQRDADIPLLQECFSPRFRTQIKFRGEWRYKEKALLPGYVIVVTRRPVELSHELRKMSEFALLLEAGETFVPLRDDERAWMEEFTEEGKRTIPMSFGYREGDTLVVTKGPLKGREGMITRISRKKSLAFVELHVNGVRITTTVGLGIVPKA